MKPDKLTCQNCGKQIPKGKWCSDKCRMAYSRKANNPNIQPEQNIKANTNKGEQMEPEQPNPNKSDKPIKGDPELRATLTKTDKTFYARAIRDFNGDPYYNYSSELRKGKCAFCGAEYTTRLALNRYCSYQHYEESHGAGVK